MKKKSSYLSMLFTGRLNRAGYIAGSIIAALVSACFLVLGTFLSVQFNNSLLLISLLCFIISLVVFVLTTLSLTLRRLHDLGLSWYWLLPLAPRFLLELVNFSMGFLGPTFQINPPYNLDKMLADNIILNTYSFVSELYALYVIFWPGTKGKNAYGSPSNHWTILEIFCLAVPPAPGKRPAKSGWGLVKFMIKIVIGLLVFLALFVGIVIAIGTLSHH